jgi:hypothetical protein
MNFITGLHKLLVNQYFTLWSKNIYSLNYNIYIFQLECLHDQKMITTFIYTIYIQSIKENKK